MRKQQADRNDKMRDRFRKREAELMDMLSAKKDTIESKEDIN